MASLPERLTNASAKDFQQASDLYGDMKSYKTIKDAGLELAINLWSAGLETTPVVTRIIQSTHPVDSYAFHDIGEFYRDTGNFDQMERMLVAARKEPGFFNNFWLTSARKRHKFGQDPQPDLDKVRNYIETAHEFYDKYRGYSDLAEATYDVTGRPQDELLELARREWQATIDRHYEIDRRINAMRADEPEYRQALLTNHLQDIAEAHGHCGDYRRAIEFYNMLDPAVIRKDDKSLRGEVLSTKTYILYALIQSCFRNGSYSEGFAFSEQWFDGYKKLMRDRFETDSYTVLAKITLGERLYHEGKNSKGRTMFYQARRGITTYEDGVSFRLPLVDRYQQGLLRVGRTPDLDLYNLALQEIDEKSSDPHMEPIKDPYDLFSEEGEGQLDLRMRVDDYTTVAEGFARIGQFDRAKETLARIEPFGDADDENKVAKVKTLSYIAYQEKRYANK